MQNSQVLEERAECKTSHTLTHPWPHRAVTPFTEQQTDTHTRMSAVITPDNNKDSEALHPVENNVHGHRKNNEID